ncbi:MAG: hypothetical protein Q9227_001893 [Pyrenula ochraceoflavens]
MPKAGDKRSRFDVDEVLSEESDFYGDEDTKLDYEEAAAEYDPSDDWERHEHNPQVVAARNRDNHPGLSAHNEPLPVSSKKNPSDTHEQGRPSGIHEQEQAVDTYEQEQSSNIEAGAHPYNRYEGMRYARQLSDSPSDFLRRLPPSTTSTEDVGPWLWVENPSTRLRPTNEDVAGFKTEGEDLLAQYIEQKETFEEKYRSLKPVAITQKLNPFRTELVDNLKKLAKAKGIPTGKWMLFPTPEQVDGTWSLIVRYTVDGALGCSAKVATDDKVSKVRPIHVYTEDSENEDDVKRVLLKLKELGLLDTTNGTTANIYYKCDAYTHLDLRSGNEYKIKASMYSSKDMLD